MLAPASPWLWRAHARSSACCRRGGPRRRSRRRAVAACMHARRGACPRRGAARHCVCCACRGGGGGLSGRSWCSDGGAAACARAVGPPDAVRAARAGTWRWPRARAARAVRPPGAARAARAGVWWWLRARATRRVARFAPPTGCVAAAARRAAAFARVDGPPGAALAACAGSWWQPPWRTCLGHTPPRGRAVRSRRKASRRARHACLHAAGAAAAAPLLAPASTGPRRRTYRARWVVALRAPTTTAVARRRIAVGVCMHAWQGFCSTEPTAHVARQWDHLVSPARTLVPPACCSSSLFHSPFHKHTRTSQHTLQGSGTTSCHPHAPLCHPLAIHPHSFTALFTNMPAHQRSNAGAAARPAAPEGPHNTGLPIHGTVSPHSQQPCAACTAVASKARDQTEPCLAMPLWHVPPSPGAKTLALCCVNTDGPGQ